MRTYSALRSQVHTVDDAAPRPRSTPMVRSVALEVVRRVRRQLVVRLAVLEQHDRSDRDRGARQLERDAGAAGGAISRPQFGSPPWIAVLTSSELAIALAAWRASTLDAAPVTLTVTSLVAPSPPRTMPSASSRQTAVRPSTNDAVARLVDDDAAGAVGEQHHAVVGRALAVDGDRVEGVVHRFAQRAVQQRLRHRRIRGDERRASSPSSARSCPSLWPCRRSSASRRRC